jgi:hypothetical protein
VHWRHFEENELSYCCLLLQSKLHSDPYGGPPWVHRVQSEESQLNGHRSAQTWVWWIKYRMMQFTGWVALHSHKPGDLALWKSAEHLIMSIPVWLGCDGRAVHSLTVFQIILDIQSFNVSFCVDDFTAGLLKLNVLYICSYHIGCTIYGDLDTMIVWSQSSIRWATISVAARDTERGVGWV